LGGSFFFCSNNCENRSRTPTISAFRFRCGSEPLESGMLNAEPDVEELLTAVPWVRGAEPQPQPAAKTCGQDLVGVGAVTGFQFTFHYEPKGPKRVENLKLERLKKPSKNFFEKAVEKRFEKNSSKRFKLNLKS
jgi:hypothetical protein